MKVVTISCCISLLLLVACGEDPKPEQTETVETSPLEQINERIESDPENKALYMDRALLYVEEGKEGKALEDMERVLRIDSADAEAYHLMGDIHYTSTQVDLAMEDFKRCLEVDPDHEDCLLKKAEIDMLLRNYDDALENINHALRNNEFIPRAYYMKGRLYAENGDSATAASSYQTAIELDPEFYDAYIEVALLYAAAGSDLAVEYYNSALELHPNSVEALYDKGMFLQSTGFKDSQRYRLALECYEQIEAIDPENAAASFNKGFIYLEYFGVYDTAATYFSDAIRKYDLYYQAYYNRGLCYESMNEKNLAEIDYREALRIQPTYEPAALALGRVLGD